MLLRISLVIAILAGAAILYFTHFSVAPRIDTLTGDLETARQNESVAQDAERKAREEARRARADLDQTQQQLTETTTNLQETGARLAQQQRRADQLGEELTRTTGERNQAQQELARWNALGVPIEQVQAQRDLLAQVRQERDGFIEENKVLLRNNNQLRAQLSRYTDADPAEVALPTGLKGRVLAVDPRYDFVVLDIGQNQGVVENGRMIVNRDGRLIGRVEVTRVEPNRSFANVIQAWKQPDTEIMEGDVVIY
jgi:cell shape-determining protein MreC